MAAAEQPSLGDFFKSKAKKKVKATNLNKGTTDKVEAKKTKTSKEDESWEEEQVVASTMKVEVVGKLMREEEKKDEEDTSAPAWGDLRKGNKDSTQQQQINERRYPTLAKANASSSINIDDGTDGKVNIATAKNHFAALEGEDSDDDGAGVKRPKEIKPAMVSKKKGEFAKVALQREVDKYTAKPTKKKVKKEGAEDDEEEEEEEESEEEEAPAPEEERKPKKPTEKKEEKKAKHAEEDEAPEKELEADQKIQVDLVASKEKYKGRKKLPPVHLPRDELEEQKENKKVQASTSGKKKKMIYEEETDKKLAYAPF